MNKTDAIRAVIAATDSTPVLFTTGYSCRIANGIADRSNHFYMTGSMGLVASVGAGLALATGLVTVVVDGDGSLLMNPVGLIIAGAAQVPLIHLVLDDGQYASTGGQPVPAGNTDLGALARASGYQRVESARTPDALTGLLGRELADRAGPALVHCPLDDPDHPVPARVGADLAGHARRFAGHVALALTGTGPGR